MRNVLYFQLTLSYDRIYPLLFRYAGCWFPTRYLAGQVMEGFLINDAIDFHSYIHYLLALSLYRGLGLHLNLRKTVGNIHLPPPQQPH